MIESLEYWKRQIDEATENHKDWRKPYTALMRELYKQDVLFFALSKDAFDPKERTSTPLISTKDFDGAPALYVFSDIETATIWMQYYQHVTDDMNYGLIGAIEKASFGFLSVFQIARKLGVRMMLLDEGGSYVGLELDAFIDANGIDPNRIELPLNKDEFDKLIENKKNTSIRFAPIPVIPLRKTSSKK